MTQADDPTMRIAFDLDGTLIPIAGSGMQVERLGVFSRAVSREPMRAGAPSLLRGLGRRGHEVWLYTTSFRSPTRLRMWFGSFGVHLSGVVNQARHTATMSGEGLACSKYPPAFGIDLLVDDSQGVEVEGRRLGFSVLRVDCDDATWCSRVESAVSAAENRMEPK
jgi:hypothetical protein